MSDSLRPHGLNHPWNSLGQNTGVGSLSLLQGIFSTQGPNPGLLYYRWILYQLSHRGSPRILEWVAYAFSGDLPDPGIKPGSPALQVDSLPTKLSGKPISRDFIHLFKQSSHWVYKTKQERHGPALQEPTIEWEILTCQVQYTWK